MYIHTELCALRGVLWYCFLLCSLYVCFSLGRSDAIACGGGGARGGAGIDGWGGALLVGGASFLFVHFTHSHQQGV